MIATVSWDTGPAGVLLLAPGEVMGLVMLGVAEVPRIPASRC
ncbi:hypothetical protein AB0L59_18630 [Streptomyces sp. NPDC052109]